MQDDQSKVFLKFSGHFRDRFEIYEKIGSGSTGTAFKAKDKTLDRTLAIKVLNSDRLSEKDIAKLHREARTTCKLKHPSIVEIFDFILTDDNRPVMVMEYVEGLSLEKLVEESGPIPLDEATTLFIQICEAMEYAHSQGILHRDLTPGNIIVRNTTGGAFDIKILDFGIAKIDRIDDLRISHSGVLIGTVTVISPEQARGQATDARSDVYSMGCLMFKVLTGRYPFEGDTPMEIAYHQINDRPPTLASVAPYLQFPVEMEKIISKTLEKPPEDRFASMNDLKQKLKSISAVAETEDLSNNPQSPEFKLFGGTEKESEKKVTGKVVNVAALIGATLGASMLLALLLFQLLSPPPSSHSEKHTFSADQNKLFTLGGIPIESSESTIWYLQNEQKWRRVHKKLDDQVLTELVSPGHLTVKRINMRKASFDLTRLRKLLELNIVALDLRDTEADDKTLGIIALYPSVKSLVISGCKGVTDQGIREIAKLPYLTAFAAGGTGITDDAIPILATIKSLRHVNIENNNRITDAALLPLLSCQHLESLDVSATSVSHKGVKLLLVSPSNVKLLALANLNLTDNVIEPSGIKTDFVFLELSNNRFTGDVFRRLCNLYDLWILNVNDCPAITLTDKENYGRRSYGKRVLLPSSEMVSNNTEWYLEPTWYELDWSMRNKKLKLWANMERIYNE